IIMVQDSKTGEFVEHQRLDGVKREFVDLKNIPVNLQNAVVAIEDERFHEHYGVDWKRTVSAVANIVLHFRETEYGGSTLTQQLVKNLTGNDDHTIERKITEILTAIELEQQYSMDEILQAYLNIIPLTGTIEGVGAGAQYYFGKDVSELSLAECAVLASITNNPSKYNPYRRPENLLQRQRTVLRKMHELGFITTDEYQQALGEEIYFSRSSQAVTVYDYYTEMVIDDVIRDLQSTYGYTEVQAENMVFYGGLTIYSCEDPELQAKVEAIYADDENFVDIKGDEENAQASIFVMDYTGKAVAVAGGRGEKKANRILNRATDSMRQPGSAMKPIAIYAPAVYNNVINYSSPIRDMYITLKNGSKWPKNYNRPHEDRGMTTIEKAIQSSMNTVPAQILNSLMPVNTAFDFLTKSLHMTSLDKTWDRDFAPMALGGLTNGVYGREIAAAYQIFGNGGIYNEPYSYTKVVRNGEVILQNGPGASGYISERALDADSAYITNRLLQTVVFGNDAPTAKDLKSSWKEWEIFAKTGTTQDNNDVWLVGGTPKYVAASWYGYDQNQELTTAQKKVARNVWNTVMLALHEGDEPMTFDAVKAATVEAVFCDETGLLATDACKKTETGVYKAGHMPATCSHGAVIEEEKPDTLPGKHETTSSTGTTSTAAPTTTTLPATTPTTTDDP
ncbi:MAG: transglycosylase domain-containing protein, partial [Clostridia bacterium]|nr:transglycosylase domain-containing protein [Clostridia bacterium]